MNKLVLVTPIFLLITLTTVQSAPLIWAGCNITTGSSGTGSVVFTLNPSPQTVLAGLSTFTPSAIYTALNSYAEIANGVINTIVGTATLPFGKAPNCRWKWMTNQIFCDNVNLAAMKPLCSAVNLFGNFISNVSSPISFPAPRPVVLPANSNLACEADINSQPYGLTQMGAPCAWNSGIKGAGIVVANIDTGVRGTHQELVSNMRPTFNWYDPYNISATTPTDVYGHGTHTMATMVGKTVGMAPGAQWIACRGCSSDTCGQEQLIDCATWLACPDNNTQSCSTKPHIINLSVGGSTTDYFQSVLTVWKSMGIAGFISAGNSGPSCATLDYPASSNYSRYSMVAVGAVTCSEAIASFSSAGPSTADEYLGGLGPQIIGSGQNIRSAWNTSDTAYNTISGTSMSSPGTAGAAALLLSSNQQSPASLFALMLSHTYQNPNITSANSPGAYCGGPSTSSSYPNNVYGYGRVDVCLCLGQPNPYNS